MEVDEEVYLAHYGVKGMRWGVRREQQAIDNSTPKQNRRRGYRNLALGIAAGAASGLAIGAILKRSGGIKVSSLSGLSSSKHGESFVRDRLRRAPKAKVINKYDGNSVQQNSKTLVDAGKAALKEILNHRSQTKIIDVVSRDVTPARTKSFFEKNIPTFRRMVKSL